MGPQQPSRPHKRSSSTRAFRERSADTSGHHQAQHRRNPENVHQQRVEVQNHMEHLVQHGEPNDQQGKSHRENHAVERLRASDSASELASGIVRAGISGGPERRQSAARRCMDTAVDHKLLQVSSSSRSWLQSGSLVLSARAMFAHLLSIVRLALAAVGAFVLIVTFTRSSLDCPSAVLQLDG